MDRRKVFRAIVRLTDREPLGFSAPQLARETGLSRQSAHSWARKFVGDGYLIAVGMGKATLYRAAPYPAEPLSFKPSESLRRLINAPIKPIHANTQASFNAAWQPPTERNKTSTG